MSFYRKIKTQLLRWRKDKVNFDDSHSTSDRLVAGSEFAYSDGIVHGIIIVSDRIIRGSVVDSDQVTNAAGHIGSDFADEVSSDDSSSRSKDIVYRCRLSSPESVSRSYHIGPQELSDLAAEFYFNPDDEQTVKHVRELPPSDLHDLTWQMRHRAQTHATQLERVISSNEFDVPETSPHYGLLFDEAIQFVSRMDKVERILGNAVLAGKLRHELKYATETGLLETGLLALSRQLDGQTPTDSPNSQERDDIQPLPEPTALLPD